MKKRTLFKIAISVHSDRVGGYTARDFAADHDVSATVLYDVLRGRTTSARLEGEIESFIREQLDFFQKSELRQAA